MNPEHSNMQVNIWHAKTMEINHSERTHWDHQWTRSSVIKMFICCTVHESLLHIAFLAWHSSIRSFEWNIIYTSSNVINVKYRYLLLQYICAIELCKMKRSNRKLLRKWICLLLGLLNTAPTHIGISFEMMEISMNGSVWFR